MIEAIVSGLVLAVLSGLTFLAYKHPDGFRRIGLVLAFPAVLLPLFYICMELGYIHGGIRLLGEEAASASGDKVEVFRSSIERLNDSLTCFFWAVAITLAAWVYVAFLWFMPQILGLQKKQNTQPKKRHISSS
ncbi:MAG: hypothetical protein MUP16_08935 [Sedimentisphaerales bacterium]|nr:hypothetical protein [Sedimentisphaerales bacterium]